MSTATSRIAQNAEPLTASARAKSAVAADDDDKDTHRPQPGIGQVAPERRRRGPDERRHGEHEAYASAGQPAAASSSAKKGMNAEPATPAIRKSGAATTGPAEVGPRLTGRSDRVDRCRAAASRSAGPVLLSVALTHQVAW